MHNTHETFLRHNFPFTNQWRRVDGDICWWVSYRTRNTAFPYIHVPPCETLWLDRRFPDPITSVSSSVPWKAQHLHCQWKQMESGRPVTSEARGWRGRQQAEAGISCLTGRTPASLSQCAMSQPWQREIMSGLRCTRGALTQTSTPSAFTFTRSAKH